MGDKWGYIDKTGKMVIEPQFDSGGYFSSKLAVVGIGEHYPDRKYGYIDAMGKVVIEPKFKEARSFREGLALARVIIGGILDMDGQSVSERYYGKCGFIDKTGKWAIEPQFKDAWSFSEGLALVEKGGKQGWIDNTGKWAIEPQFYVFETVGFCEGLAAVATGLEHGYIDKTGRMVIKPQFKDAKAFSEGLAAVHTGLGWGYIDRTGKMAVETQQLLVEDYKDYSVTSVERFSDGLAVIGISIVRYGNFPSIYGYIDKSGNWAIRPRFDEAGYFSKGLARVAYGVDKYAYIDKSGNWIIEQQFNEAGYFSDGLARVKISKYGAYGYIDRSGNWAIKPQFDEAGDFSEGLAAVKI